MSIDRFRTWCTVTLVTSIAVSTFADAPSNADLRKLLETGEYHQAIEAADRAIKDDEREEAPWQHKLRAHLAVGQYREAREALEAALKRFSFSVRLRVLGVEVLQAAGESEKATLLLAEIEALIRRMPWRYTDAPDLVALGRTAVHLGADPRQVLEVFYDRAKKEDPKYIETYLAMGELALAKHDDAVAADAFQEGLKVEPENPDLLFGLALAFSSSDDKKTDEAITAALKLNPNHVPALLFVAENEIDAERYLDAAETIGRALNVNYAQPSAWALLAVLAHLNGDIKHESALRATALRIRSVNPEVDHLIGKKLSQKYRFAEGAEYQQRALAAQANHLPAKVQLSQDLLRLGQAEEGWKLAQEVANADGYDVLAYNLVTLESTLKEFRTLRSDGFVVRMEAREADIYGDRVLDLLRRAKQTLGERYGFAPREPVTVEIFHRQSDFAVRTFGMPGGAGYLGVCFGKVITANSPQALGATQANWESVLWHEFCHVVTLQLSNNKMPRWLSEGISVYEERQLDPSWGQSMTPQYRELITSGKLTPIGSLSAAFLSPPSPFHLQFAYYESSLVVEFLIARFGVESIRSILQDLGAGMPINEAIARRTGVPLERLESDFAGFATQKAEAFGPKLDWERPKGGERSALSAALDLLKDRPNNYWGLLAQAKSLLKEEKWSEAKDPLRKLLELVPDDISGDGAYPLLAVVYRKLNDTKEELAVLNAWAALDADARDAYLRLVELESSASNWKAVETNAKRLLAVNPLLPQGHHYLARANEKLGDTKQAIAEYRTLLLTSPPDPADVNYRLARLLFQANDPAAKRHVLVALEHAPRYRDAQRLLLEIRQREEPGGNASADPP